MEHNYTKEPMMVSLVRNRNFIFVTVFFVSFITLMLLISGKSFALSGAPSNLFPDTSYGMAGPSYGIVQVTGWNVPNANVKMKARETLANIYVPSGMVNQAISITVVDGCDGTIRDNNPGAGSTTFLIVNDSTGAWLSAANSKGNCAGTDVQMSFTATAINAGDTNNTTENYNMYTFYAFGNMAEAGSSFRYLNAFQVRANTPNVRAGLSDKAPPCDNVSYPMSCPNPYPGTGTSIAYSSLYGPWGVDPWAQKIDILSPCDAVGKISLYDLDADINFTPAQNLNIRMQKNGVDMTTVSPNGTPFTSLPQAAIKDWDVGINPPGLLSAHSPYGGKNNQYLDLPGGDPMFSGVATFQANVPYTFIIEGISNGNAIQLTAGINHCNSPPTCNITSVTNMSFGSAIAPNEQFRFNVTTANASGYVLGVNGPAWGSPGDFGNYLVAGNQYIRTPVPPNGAQDVTLYRYDDSSPFNQAFRAPSAPGVYSFNWGLVIPGTAWAPGSCSGTLTVIQPDTAPTISITQNCALPYTINITVNDADYATNGANPILNYSINGAAQAAVSARTITFNMPDGTVGISVSANSDGVNSSPPGGLGTINASATQNFPRCRAPDSAPTFTVTQNCTPPFTITITVNDPDYATNGGNPTINYSINGAAQAAVSARSITFNMPDPTASVVVAANTLGVNPNPPSGLGTTFVSYSPQTFLKCADSFTLTSQPQPPVLDDTELPTSADFTAPIGFSGSAVAVNNVATNRDFFFNRGGVYSPAAGTIVGGATVNLGASVGASVNVTTKPLDNVLGVMTRGGIPVAQVGDNICIRLTLSPATGLVNGAGVIFAGASGNSIRVQCTTVLNKPYLKAYGSDILAGVGFGNSCPAAPAANITAFARLVGGNWVGAGTQLGALASGNIVTFATSMLRTPASPADRAFSNTSVPYPGNFGANFCSDDFWASRSGSLAVGPNKDLTAMSGQYQIAPNQTLLISASPLSGQFALYIDGDVTIDKDIITSAGPWASYANIPSVYIIARGNIYIAPTVKRLDGVYVAMPRFPAVSLGTPADGGRIFTCTDNGSTPSSAALYGTCMQNTLTVNGAFAAKHVDFLRGKGTLRTAVSAEVGTSGNIAEVFNYSPDLFMTLASPSPRLTTGSYDSVISLPPAL